jgi:hypothetical protein
MTTPKMDVNDKMQVLSPGKQAHCGKQIIWDVATIAFWG